MTLQELLAHQRFRTLQRDGDQYTAYAVVPGQRYTFRFGGGRTPEIALAMALALMPGETESMPLALQPVETKKPVPVFDDDDEL